MLCYGEVRLREGWEEHRSKGKRKRGGGGGGKTVRKGMQNRKQMRNFHVIVQIVHNTINILCTHPHHHLKISPGTVEVYCFKLFAWCFKLSLLSNPTSLALSPPPPPPPPPLKIKIKTTPVKILGRNITQGHTEVGTTGGRGRNKEA